jgi:intracellular sulfur oxidation DsrE/DsrF family protein
VQRLKLVLIGMFGAMLLVGATVNASIAAETKAAVADTKATAHNKKKAAVKKERVVLQVSDDSPKTWNQALNVIENVQEAYGKDKVEIKLVAFGLGLGILKLDSVAGSRVQDALQSGAQIIACENTMRRQKLTKADMLPNIGYAPAGIIEIIKLQRQGWAVVRP